MRSRKLFSAGIVVLGALATAGRSQCLAATTPRSSLSAQESTDGHIIDVTAITEIFSDGMKVSAVAVQYDRNIKDSSLKPADFTVTTDVPSQKITRVYTSDDGLKSTRRNVNGKYVILELSTDYVIPVSTKRMPPPGPPPGGQPAPRHEPAKQDVVLNPEVVTRVGNISWEPAAHPASLKSSKHGGNGKSVSVVQTGSIVATDGTTLPATTVARDNVYCRNLLVDGFMKPDFKTPTGSNVKYSIHFPSNYDPARKYPVVVFLDDSLSPTSFTHAEYLVHGQGGVIWASKEDEAKHPAIVVVPALSRPLVNEDYQLTTENRPGGQSSTPYTSILSLVDGLTTLVPDIDTSRMYITGQGDGARAAIRMMVDRPHLFAAALLMAPDYDPKSLDAAQISQLAKSKVWIVTSADDTASTASMASFTAALKASGAKVDHAEWSGRASEAQMAGDVRRVASAGANVDDVILRKGTILPSGVPDDIIENHAYTWQVGYAIPALRDWLFSQSL